MTERHPYCDACNGGGCPYCWIEPDREPAPTGYSYRCLVCEEPWMGKNHAENGCPMTPDDVELHREQDARQAIAARQAAVVARAARAKLAQR